jgi:hypothetical protein
MSEESPGPNGPAASGSVFVRKPVFDNNRPTGQSLAPVRYVDVDHQQISGTNGLRDPSSHVQVSERAHG